jgi:DNA-binding winged helix-turn-helix (wHTH) protein
LLKTRHIYRFGSFSLDPATKVLLKDGQPVRMTRKAVETLLILVENGGQVLTKDEIISAVWPDRVVDEANLTQNVAVIRRTLGVERGSPGYIETYAGRGYRLLGPIDAVEQAAPAGLSVVPMPRRHHWAVAAALMAVALGLFVIFRRSAPEPQSAYRIIPVTRTPGREFQPAVSPDGTRVAFVWASEDAKTNGVWMQAFDETSPHPVSQRWPTCAPSDPRPRS